MPQEFESLGHYHDHLVYVMFYGGNFHEETWEPPGMTQRERLDAAFAKLRASSRLPEKKLKDPRRIGVFRELVEMSYEAFAAGERVVGAQLLREAEGMVWVSRAGRPRYVVEAERRAFGEVVLYRDVVVEPHPREGTEADLGDAQRQLWRHGASEVQKVVEPGKSAAGHWVMEHDGTIRRVPGRSQKACRRAMRDLAAAGRIKGAATASLTFGDLLAVSAEEPGKPLIRITRRIREGAATDWRFHLGDPELFTAGTAKVER